MTSILVSREIAADALSISVVTLDRLVKADKIRPTRIGRKVLFTDADLRKFAAQCRKESK
ncbi:MAG: helix-turn-helix domain-containing protein [Candidatus Sulfotelmatobacter sp.]